MAFWAEISRYMYQAMVSHYIEGTQVKIDARERHAAS